MNCGWGLDWRAPEPPHEPSMSGRGLTQSGKVASPSISCRLAYLKRECVNTNSVRDDKSFTSTTLSPAYVLLHLRNVVGNLIRGGDVDNPKSDIAPARRVKFTMESDTRHKPTHTRTRCALRLLKSKLSASLFRLRE